MSTQTTVRSAALPRVNLLPPEIAEERRFRGVQGLLGVVILVALGAIGMVYLSAMAAEGDAQEELSAAQARQTVLQREEAQFADVPIVHAQVAKAETLLVSAMGSEVRWSQVMSDTHARIPADVALKRLAITQGADKGAIVQGVETGGPIIATVAFSGVTISPDRNGARSNLAAWLEALARQKHYANPYFTVSELKGKDVIDFSSSIDVNHQVLSRRYTSEKAK